LLIRMGKIPVYVRLMDLQAQILQVEARLDRLTLHKGSAAFCMIDFFSRAVQR
jgi:hypothetical protein